MTEFSLHLIKHHFKKEYRAKVELHAFLTSSLDEVSNQLHSHPFYIQIMSAHFP
jgi:hypothetical protein